MPGTAQNIYIVIVWVVLSLTCLVLLNQLWAPSSRRAHNDVIGWQLSILGTIYAVMIGFMLYAVWANFQAAETNVDNEANSLVNLFRTADGLPAAQRDAIRIAAANYTNGLLNQEWGTMSRDQVPHGGQLFIMQMWAIMTHTPVQNEAQLASLQQAMQELNSVTEHRRVRILQSRSKIPPILWTVLVIGGIVTIASACLIGSDNFQLHFSLILALSLLISMALVTIQDMDRPFQGAVRVSPYPFVRAQQTMLNPTVVPQ